MNSYSAKQWMIAVDKLINMTERGEIEWEWSQIFRGDANDQLDEALEVHHRGKIYVISRARKRQWSSEEDYHYTPFYDLSIYERRTSGLVKLGSAPEMISLYNLYISAKESFAKNSGALDDLL